MNIILAGLGLGSITVGSWFDEYSIYLYALTFSLLVFSFYRIYYKHKGDVGRRTKIVLWSVASMSLVLTCLSIAKRF